MTSCVKGTRSPSSVKNGTDTPGNRAGSLPRTGAVNFRGLTIISVSLNDTVPRNGACAAWASGPGTKAAFAVNPPDQFSNRNSADGRVWRGGAESASGAAALAMQRSSAPAHHDTRLSIDCRNPPRLRRLMVYE